MNICVSVFAMLFQVLQSSKASQIQGQVHTFLPAPSLKGYTTLLPGSTSSNTSLCGFKELKKKEHSQMALRSKRRKNTV